MSKYRWLSLSAALGITVVALSLCVRADEEEVADSPQEPPATFSNGETPANEKSVLRAQPPVEAEPGKHDFCHCVGEDKSPAHARIEETLRGPLHSEGIEYTEAPLNEVISDLGSEYGILMLLDEKSLEEIGLGSDEPVTVQLRNISLQSALRLMLEKLDLTYIIRDEVLWITTNDEAQEHLVMCVYDVDELVDGGKAESMDSLIDAIVTCVATETWAENGGGEAEVRPLTPGLLVVSQTHAIQEEVAGLLASIRKMRERVPFTHSHVHEPEPAEQ